jgi:hypothetical protein
MPPDVHYWKNPLSFSYVSCETTHIYVFTGGKSSTHREILTLWEPNFKSIEYKDSNFLSDYKVCFQ